VFRFKNTVEPPNAKVAAADVPSVSVVLTTKFVPPPPRVRVIPLSIVIEPTVAPVARARVAELVNSKRAEAPARWPFASEKLPPTFHVLELPETATLELVMSTAPLVNVTLFCVAVPAPELASNVTVSVAPGMHEQAAPPLVVDQ